MRFTVLFYVLFFVAVASAMVVKQKVVIDPKENLMKVNLTNFACVGNTEDWCYHYENQEITSSCCSGLECQCYSDGFPGAPGRCSCFHL